MNFPLHLTQNEYYSDYLDERKHRTEPLEQKNEIILEVRGISYDPNLTLINKKLLEFGEIKSIRVLTPHSNDRNELHHEDKLAKAIKIVL